MEITNNSSKLEIEVYKNDNDKELMNKEKTITTTGKLEKNEKNKVYYTIISTGKKKPSEDEKISIKISD